MRVHLRCIPPHVPRQGYLPCEMYDLDTPYGGREELKALCAELNAAGIVPLADVVINHRSAGAKGPEGLWNVFTCVRASPRCLWFPIRCLL